MHPYFYDILSFPNQLPSRLITLESLLEKNFIPVMSRITTSFFLWFVIQAELSHGNKDNLMNFRVEIHDAPDTDMFGKPDLHIEAYKSHTSCIQRTKPIDGSYNPAFPEVFSFKYEDEFVEFDIYENEAIKDYWKLGVASLWMPYLKGVAHYSVSVSKPDGSYKSVKNKAGNVTTLHIFKYSGDYAKLKVHEKPIIVRC
ncbi:uncharacterized protein LOC110855471 [Folsomia candida]|uniref:uncharacterized protein LOC110855471 n=1 Tax=Folsomia candida TaxID=158441 RepID=UPI001604F598|nr:uncharacterized protein LOC110855471 [Folsomia candida]